MASRPHPAHHRVPGLDGVRALAVAAVMAYHGGLGWAGGGFLGVDVFFVLSGYLITSLLLDEWEASGTIALGRFWSRRARRLLPALLLLLAGVTVYARIFTPADTLASLRRDGLAAVAYVANWRFILAGRSYFARSSAPSLLQHTWSLAIEEQFYLVWPLVVLAVLRLRRGAAKATLLGLVSVAAVASAIEMAVLYRPGADPSRVYFGTDTHAQSVLIGAALAIVLSSRLQRSRLSPGAWSGIGVAGVLLTGLAVAKVSAGSTALYRGGFLAVDLAAVAVVASLVRHEASLLSRLLSLRPLRAIGAISYGLYLWHWPVFLAVTHARTGASGPVLLFLRVAVTAALSVASYALVEMPVRRATFRPLTRRVLAPAAVALAAAVVMVMTSTPPLGRASIAAAAANRAVGSPVSRGSDTVQPRVAAPTPKEVLIEGDSVAMTLGLGLYVAQPPYGLDIQDRGQLGCGVALATSVRDRGNVSTLPASCRSWPATWAADVNTFNPDLAVVLVGRWEVMDRVFDGRWTHIGDPTYDRYVLGQLELAVHILSGRGAHVVLLTMPCENEGEQPQGGTWPQDSPERIARFNALVTQAAANSGGRADVVDLWSLVCPGGRFASMLGGVQVRNGDGVHFTIPGGIWLGPQLLPELARLAALRTPTPPAPAAGPS